MEVRLENPFGALEERYGDQLTEPQLLAAALGEILRAMDVRRERAGQGPEPPTASRVKRDGKWVWRIPKDCPHSECKYCEQRVHWIKTPKKGAIIPLDSDGVAHFERCKARSAEWPK